MLILIDGIDLSGKTTITKQLEHQLIRSGYNVRINKNTLHQGLYNKLLDAIHSKQSVYLPNWIVSILDCLAPWVDSFQYKRPPFFSITVQESYVDRAIGYLYIYKKQFLYHFLRWSKKYFVQFDLAIYLTASFEVRRSRYEQRKNNRKGDRILINNQIALKQMEDKMIECMSSYPVFFQIDTSNIGVQDIVDIIVCKIDSLLKT